MPTVRVVHSLPWRVRLEAPALVDHPEAAERVGRALTEEVVCDRVRVRAITGSVVVESREGGLQAALVAQLLGTLLAREVDDAGQPLGDPRKGRSPGPTRMAKAITHAFAEINASVRDALDDRADLGTVMPVLFAIGGIADVAVTRKLPTPPWFNLLWWSVRSFMTFNASALEEEASQNGHAPPERMID